MIDDGFPYPDEPTKPGSGLGFLIGALIVVFSIIACSMWIGPPLPTELTCVACSHK